MKKNWKLFLVFLKIGVTTFGGGYAMIALLENEFVSKRQWLDKNEFLDMVAISESTPGPIAINAATYIGYQLMGVWGAILATISICIPSFAIIYGISLFLDRFLTLTWVANAFRGIQMCVIYLIASAGLKLLKQMKKTPFHVAIVSVVILCMVTFSVLAVSFSTIFYIFISGILGFGLYLIDLLRRRKGAGK